MKKVLFVATVVQKHINVFHLPFLKMFQEQGYKTYVAASNDTGKEKVEIQYCDEYVEIDFKRNPLHPGNVSAYSKLKELIDREKFDIVHCHTPVGGLLGRLAAIKARKSGTRVFYTAHGFHFYKGAPLKNWLMYYPVEKFCSRFTDVLITINQEDYALAKKKMKSKKVEYVPGVGIDLSRFRNATVDRAEKRREIGVPEDATMLISVGEISERKNHRLVLEALVAIESKNIHYVLVGNGPLTETHCEYIKSKNIDGRVHFLGYRKDIPELYKASDLCCFPSIHEGLPVALMEAMACGLPIVCSNIRGNIDLIDKNGGILFNQYSVDECKKAIVDILDKDMECMKDYNAKCVEQYSIDKVLPIMKSIYES